MRKTQTINSLFILFNMLLMITLSSSGKLNKLRDPARDEEDFTDYGACSDRKNKERCSEALNINGPYKCESDLDCRGKRVCMLNTCKHECKSTKDCPKGMKCYENACYAHKSHHSRIKEMNDNAKGKSRHRNDSNTTEDKSKQPHKEEDTKHDSKHLKGLNGEKQAAGLDLDNAKDKNEKPANHTPAASAEKDSKKH